MKNAFRPIAFCIESATVLCVVVPYTIFSFDCCYLEFGYSFFKQTFETLIVLKFKHVKRIAIYTQPLNE